jgi:formylglycine-generating enzyme required for sulfatase activity
MSENMGFGDRPALRMSRLNAERFVDWLNEHTGKNFRIPTEDEWELALRLGGNDPNATDAPANVLDIAVTDNDFETLPVGSKEPNALGIYDMIGNVSEWVTATGAERAVRGGSFMDVAPHGGMREVEDMGIWNAGYPNDPKSKWWYVDAYDVGLRLVCDP